MVNLAVAQAPPEPSGVLNLRAIDGVLVLTLDPKASFDALRVAVRDAFSATPDRFRGMDARLDLGDRGIDLFDLRRIIHVLKDEFGVTVTGLFCTSESLLRYAERELKLRIWTHRVVEPELPTPEPAPESIAPQEEAPSEPPHSLVDDGVLERTLTLDRSIRSGQVVRFAGDVLVFGDVNPGAEVIAGGNVLVFGTLKGMVQAGTRSEDRAFVMGFDLRPAQLRIGSRIAFPAERSKAGAKSSFTPEIAWVDKGEIVIDPYTGRLPR